jgi:hypothetical protein
MLAFPEILLALAIVAILGPALTTVMVGVGIASIPHYTRVVRGVCSQSSKRSTSPPHMSSAVLHLGSLFGMFCPTPSHPSWFSRLPGPLRLSSLAPLFPSSDWASNLPPQSGAAC